MTLSNIEAWQYILVVLSPYLVSLLNRPGWSSSQKRWAMISVSVVLALVTAAIKGEFAPFRLSMVLQYTVLMIGATQVMFTGLSQIALTKKTLDKTEVLASDVKPSEAVQQKAEVKAAEVQDFKENVV